MTYYLTNNDFCYDHSAGVYSLLTAIRLTSEVNSQSVRRAPSFSLSVRKHGGDGRRSCFQKGTSNSGAFVIRLHLFSLVAK